MDWSKCNVPDLKKALIERGAKTSGKKADLIKRLEDYERNSNFVGPYVALPEADPMPNFPPLASFHTMTLEDRFSGKDTSLFQVCQSLIQRPKTSEI